MISGEDLLVGPYGRELCAAIAQQSAPGDVWIHATDEAFLGALRAVRPEQVAALDERRVLADLESVVSSAVYWQEPHDDRVRLARPALRRWREGRGSAERRLFDDADWRFTGGQWWSDPAFSGAAWTTPGLPGLGPSLVGVAESPPCASTWGRTTPASRPRTSSPNT